MIGENNFFPDTKEIGRTTNGMVKARTTTQIEASTQAINDTRHGRGEYKYSDEDMTYIGMWRHGKRSGKEIS